MKADKALPGPAEYDPAILEGCRTGDRLALEHVLRAETPALERLLRRIVGPGTELEDLLQATLIAAVEAFPRYRGEASVRTWLAAIGIRTTRDQLRRVRRRRAELRLVPPASGAPSTERQVAARELLARLHEHLDSLSVKKRIAFVLHVVEGYPMIEVAALMGATLTATKSRVLFARRAILARVRRDPELSDLVERSR